ncbi:hypothetical protein ACIQXD_14305 [Streptomyces uncialis]|uniref:hypothetical protein n=1 Tax=Streptomyces uncialis TaxID=1048205 RepID=UPI003809197E
MSDIQRWMDEAPSRSFCVIGKGKAAHMSRGNDESLCGRLMMHGSRYITARDTLDYKPCASCWKIMERESAEIAKRETVNEGDKVAATKLKMSEVRGDVRVGAVPGSSTIHALKNSANAKGNNIAYCPTRSKTPIRSWGKAHEQKPHLELCIKCSPLVPTGPVEVTETRVAIPGLDRTVTVKTAVPTTEEKKEENTMAAKGMDKAAQEKAAEEIRSSITRLPSLILEGKEDSAKELSEEIGKQIPTITGTGAAAVKAKLRAELTKVEKDAKKAKADADRAKADKPKSTEVATRETRDPMKVVGVPELIEQSIELVKEVATNEFHGAYKIAEKIFAMRTVILDHEEDPDLGARRQGSKDAAKLVWDGVLNALPPQGDDENADVIRASIGQLKKQQQNAMTDVVVNHLRWLDNETPKDEVEANALTVERKKFAKMIDAYPNKKPSEAIHAYYDAKDKPLPKKTRAEAAKENRERKALERATVEEAVKAGELSQEEADATLNGGGEEEKTPKEVRAAYVKRVTNGFKAQLKAARAIEDDKAQEEALADLEDLLSDLRKELKKAPKSA